MKEKVEMRSVRGPGARSYKAFWDTVRSVHFFLNVKGSPWRF